MNMWCNKEGRGIGLILLINSFRFQYLRCLIIPILNWRTRVHRRALARTTMWRTSVNLESYFVLVFLSYFLLSWNASTGTKLLIPQILCLQVIWIILYSAKQVRIDINFLYILGTAIPLDQEPIIAKSICPPFESYDECYSVDYPGTSNDQVMLLKAEKSPNVLLGQLKDHPNSVAIAIRSPLDYWPVTKVYFSYE